MSDHLELQALSQLSANLGRNPLLVQAATGNTSIKIGPKLWIKASGTWLADADRRNIFLPVDWAEIRAGVGNGVHCRADPKNSPGGNGQSAVEKPLPSVETPLHSVMPHRVVIHVHSVNTIARAVRRDGPTHLASLLDGLAWQWIPYVSSGLPLALQTQRVTFSSPDVLVLANHGLVIGADNFGAAEALLQDVETRLAAVPRTSPEPQWSQLERMTAGAPSWRVPSVREVHALATDAKSCAILTAGTLYPCQAVFLGFPTAVMPPDGCVAESEKRYQARYGASPAFLVVEGSGVLVRQNMTVTQAEVLLGLSHVVQRIEADAPIRYLTDDDLEDLVSADVHQYLCQEDDVREIRSASDMQKPPLHAASESPRAELL